MINLKQELCNKMKLLRDFRVTISSIIILALLLLSLLAPVLPVRDPFEMNFSNMLEGRSSSFLLGTDEYGRDLLSRILYGTRVTLSVAFAATTIAAILGCLLGICSAYFRGWSETFLMRITEVLVSFPPVLLAMIVVGLWGPGMRNLILSIGVIHSPMFARLSYGVTKSEREREYVKASKSLGASNTWIIAKVLLPNIAAPIIVQFAVNFAWAALLAGGLSFLGLGIIPPRPSLGNILAGARSYMALNWSYFLWPAVVLGTLITAVNILSEGLREALDPKQRGSIV